ncbi:RNA-directed DNA polymerase [Rhizobium sp. S-51]|uniref:RNA-directed DNA polymerase n=1 Tax=Rhizobium terricola TaxID=2728849 RepID=A0A7Y0AYA4_9HYPH|nr:reverse transcriptase domain-containing protein [Rhizobium terricola]NML75651.1 RNA-directed DNA polymerase [Rhizobium terricola]
MPPRSYYKEPRVSDYIAFADAYFPEERNLAAEFAERTRLPYVESSKHLAAYVGVSPSLLRQIMHKPSYHYREFPLHKADGSERKISTPKTYLKVVQWWVLDNILARQALDECVHGFRSGRSYVTNARVHQNSRHILNVDIKSFFDSIKMSQVANVFLSLGYSEAGSLTLTALTTKDGVAPTGAPTSPMIANLIFRDADLALAEFAEANGLIYSRYADDLTFSGQHRIPDEAVAKIAEIVNAAGFELNIKKTKFMGPGDRQDVTGVVVNSGLNAPREWRNWARGYLHRVRLNPDKSAEELGRVRGVYGILRQFDPERTKSLTRAAFETLEALKQYRTEP